MSRRSPRLASANSSTRFRDLKPNSRIHATIADATRFVQYSSKNPVFLGAPTRYPITAADGTGQVERLKDGVARPYAWGADGRLVFQQVNGIGALTMEGERTVEMLLDAAVEPALSPDGRCLAYVFVGTGLARTFVHPFPNIDGGEWVVSLESSVNPVWSADGRELFYRAQNGTDLMATQVETEPTFSSRTPEPLFSLSNYKVAADASRWFDLAPDGRFVMLKLEATAGDDGPSTA